MKNKKKVFLFKALAVILFIFCSSCSASDKDSKQLEMISLYQQYKQDLFPNVEGITPRQVKELDEKAVFVDIRDKKEQQVSMLPGAITQDEFEDNIDSFKDKKIVLYCTIGNRSGRYAKALKKKGIKAYNLAGGILAWSWEGQKLQNKGEPTNRVHVYGPKWNLLPDDYIPVW